MGEREMTLLKDIRKKLIDTPIKIGHFTLSLGAMKVIFERCITYFYRSINVFNAVMLIAISQQLGADLNQYAVYALIGGIGLLIFALIDVFIILPQEASFGFEINPRMMEMQHDIKEVLKRLKFQ